MPFRLSRPVSSLLYFLFTCFFKKIQRGYVEHVKALWAVHPWESQPVCCFSREKGRSSLPSYASLVLPAGVLTGGPFSDCMTRVLTLRYPGLFGRKLCRIRWAPTPREPTQWPTLWLWLLHSSSLLERSLTSLALFLQPTPKHPQVILG